MSETKLKINSRFAQIYDKYRQKEELQRRKSYSLPRNKIFAVYFNIVCIIIYLLSIIYVYFISMYYVFLIINKRTDLCLQGDQQC